MFVYVLISILALNAGFVQNTPCGIKECAEESSKSIKQESSSYQKSASCGGAAKEVRESSTQSYSASSSKSESCTDISVYEKAFNKCTYLDAVQRELYLNYLRQLSSDKFCHFKDIIEYINYDKQFLYEDMIDYINAQKEIEAAYNFLVEKKIYAKGCNWVEKEMIFQEAKSYLSNCFKYIKPDCVLYKPLKYCLEKDISLFPFILGTYNVIFQNQRTYFKSSTTEVRSTSSSSSQTVSSSSSSKTVDVTKYETIFNSCTGLQSHEKELYLNYLRNVQSDKFCHFKDVIQYINYDKQFLYENMIDYSNAWKEIEATYNFLVEKKIYASGCNWVEKEMIFKEAKSYLSNCFKYIKPDCVLYKPLKYCLEQDMSLFPFLVGTYYHTLKKQSTYFSSSSSTTNVRSTSTSTTVKSSSTDITVFENAFSSCKALQSTERDVYIKYLKGLPSDKLCHFSDLVNYINTSDQCLYEKDILDYNLVKSEIESAYQLFVKEKFYTSDCDWVSKEAIYNELKCKLMKALSSIKKECFLYKSLEYCLNTDLTSLPFVIGIDKIIFESQATYFKSSSVSQSSYKSTSTKVESASKSVDACGC